MKLPKYQFNETTTIYRLPFQERYVLQEDETKKYFRSRLEIFDALNILSIDQRNEIQDKVRSFRMTTACHFIDHHVGDAQNWFLLADFIANSSPCYEIVFLSVSANVCDSNVNRLHAIAKILKRYPPVQEDNVWSVKIRSNLNLILNLDDPELPKFAFKQNIDITWLA